MESDTMVAVLLLIAVLLVVAVAFLVRLVLSIQNMVQSEQPRVAQELGRTASVLGVLQGAQQNLDASLRTIAGQATIRAEVDRQSHDLLRRLELVIAGSFHRGEAGENLLSEVLSVLPPGMLERNLRVAGGVVEFALRLPGGKFVPIDSKWPAVDLLEQVTRETDPARRSQLVRDLEHQVLTKAMEVGKYLDPERTLLLGIAAVPDAVYQLCRTVNTQAFKRGVIVLPYSMSVPYVLSMLVLIARFGGALDTGQIRTSLAKVDQTLQELSEALESHMSRGLTMITNSVQNQRSGIAECRSIVAALRARDEATTVLDQEATTA